jgi:hypothetical protein
VVGVPVVVGAALGWIGPAAAALVAVAVDALVLPSASRLLRRIELRVPIRRAHDSSRVAPIAEAATFRAP